METTENNNQETTERNQPPRFLFVDTSCPLVLYISMPMHGKDRRELDKHIVRMTKRAKEERNIKIKNLIQPLPVNEMEAYFPLEYLAERLKRLSKADCIMFSEDYRSSHLCLIEYRCACLCGKGILIETSEGIKSADEYSTDLGINSVALLDYTEKQ